MRVIGGITADGKTVSLQRGIGSWYCYHNHQYHGKYVDFRKAIEWFRSCGVVRPRLEQINEAQQQYQRDGQLNAIRRHFIEYGNNVDNAVDELTYHALMRVHNRLVDIADAHDEQYNKQRKTKRGD